MHPYLRQALMRYHNEFFGMTEEEQTLFKLQDHDELDEKIRIFIEDKIGMNHDDFYKNTPKQNLEYNTITLPYIGIGPNSFMLNEWQWNEKTLRFKNLYEANEYNHDFQEQSIVGDYVKKPLYNRLDEWARAYIDGEFYYLNLYSYAHWLFYDMDDIMFTWLDDNLPYNYVPGKDDGKEVNGGYLFDKELDAGGKEGWHKHMGNFAHEWIRKQFDIDITNNERFGNNVYVVDVDANDPLDPHIAYVFGSLEVLRHITYYDFINDCEKFKADPMELLAFRADRRSQFESELNEEFERIKATMPPGEIDGDKKVVE